MVHHMSLSKTVAGDVDTYEIQLINILIVVYDYVSLKWGNSYFK